MNVLTYMNTLINKVAPNILAITVIWGMINHYPIFMSAGNALYYIFYELWENKMVFFICGGRCRGDICIGCGRLGNTNKYIIQ